MTYWEEIQAWLLIGCGALLIGGIAIWYAIIQARYVGRVLQMESGQRTHRLTLMAAGFLAVWIWPMALGVIVLVPRPDLLSLPIGGCFGVFYLWLLVKCWQGKGGRRHDANLGFTLGIVLIYLSICLLPMIFNSAR